MKEIMADNQDTPRVESTEEELEKGQHDDDLSEGIKESWGDDQEMKDDSVDIDYGRGR